MKGKINAQGWLHIERAGYMKKQACPYTNVTDEDLCTCGDWCPLFGEPYEDTFDDDDGYANGTCLEICSNRRLNFTEFTDERTAQDTVQDTIIIEEVLR